MPSLDLGKLYDRSYDRRPPTILKHEKGAIWVVAANSNQRIRVPARMSGRLAYAIGVVLGDGYGSEPIERKTHGPGFHWKVVVTGPHDYVRELRRVFLDLFCISGGLKKDKRKRDSWQLRFSSLVLHRFFARVIGLPQGRKTTHKRWTRLNLVKQFPLHFLSGLIDSDGHVGSSYVGIIQNDLEFLKVIQRFAKEKLGFDFHGPHINKKRAGRITSWIISLYRKNERTKLIRAKNRLGLGYKYA